MALGRPAAPTQSSLRLYATPLPTRTCRLPLKLQGDNHKLVARSNADDSFLDISIPKLGADWHAVFTAEQAGAYKLGFRDLVMLDRGAEPFADGYNIFTVNSLDELNKHLGL
ncbi:hypothetical protein [Arthrobacter sp. OAP107]|jgi:2-haloacid dehalogenase|uniref:hypothetical protein n=1 Tax=Arthrobacter sp. OAP107 TaxID=3156445 RepID=UPI003396926C